MSVNGYIPTAPQADPVSAAVKAAQLIEGLSRQSHQITQASQQATGQLQQTVQATPGILRQAADQALSQISTNAARAVQQGLVQPLDGFNRKVVDSANSIQGASHGLKQLEERVKALVSLQKWVTASVLAILALAGTGCAMVLWHYKDVIKENQIQAELLRAYNQADVTLCGGRLCARIDKPDKRFGEYVPVKSR